MRERHTCPGVQPLGVAVPPGPGPWAQSRENQRRLAVVQVVIILALAWLIAVLATDPDGEEVQRER